MIYTRHIQARSRKRTRVDANRSGMSGREPTLPAGRITSSVAHASGRDADVATGARLDGRNLNASADDAERRLQFMSSNLRGALDGLRPRLPPGPGQYMLRCR
jgi:hypothetical protein